MNGLVKSIRHIQIKQIAYHPKLFEASITYEPHCSRWDESDDLEHQKLLMNRIVNEQWFLSGAVAPQQPPAGHDDGQ